MQHHVRSELRRILEMVARGEHGIGEALTRVVALLEEVTPPPPDQTGTPLPGPPRVAPSGGPG